MNFFETATIIAAIACAYHFGKRLGCHYGVIGWILGLIAGGCLPILIRLMISFYSNKYTPYYHKINNQIKIRKAKGQGGGNRDSGTDEKV